MAKKKLVCFITSIGGWRTCVGFFPIYKEAEKDFLQKCKEHFNTMIAEGISQLLPEEGKRKVTISFYNHLLHQIEMNTY